MASITPRTVEKVIPVLDGYDLHMNLSEALLVAALLGICNDEMEAAALGNDSSKLSFPMYNLLYVALGDDLVDSAYERLERALRNKHKRHIGD